jgi:tRNA-dihydrouridine synthase B
MNGREIYQPDLAEKQAVLLEFFDYLREEMPEIIALGKMKQLAGQFTKGLVGGAMFRQTLYHSHSAQEILDNIAIYFNTLTSQKTFGDGKVEGVGESDILSCEISTTQNEQIASI